MRSVSSLPKLKDKHVLIRVDYNVPLVGNRIVDVRKIESSYKTIDAVIKKGGVPILVSHIETGKKTLRPIATFLSKKYKRLLFISKKIDDPNTVAVIRKAMKGTVVLLENIRQDEREEKNDRIFSRILASLGNFYVNEAFPVSHRTHASIVGVPKYLKSFAGFHFQEEIKELNIVVKSKKHPFLFILGGAKFSTKIPLIKKFLSLADSIVITGATLNNFYKAGGFEIGASVIEDGYENIIKKLLKNPKVLLPIDVAVLRNNKKLIVTPSEVIKGDKISDIGPRSVALIEQKIAKAKLVVWNGPTGWYEGGFNKATLELAQNLAESKAKVVIGGGDTAAVIEKLLPRQTKKKSSIFVSTGGGATLDFLSKGTLPGIRALH